MSVRAWVKAARLPAQANIAAPLLVGASLATSTARPLRISTACLVFAFGLFAQLFIVFANDVADVETDRANTTHTPFSGGSRVLVDGLLTPSALAMAARGSAIGTCAVSAALAWLIGSPLPLALAVAALLLLWAYSFPPLSLSYRGGGELAQIAGTAVLLPVYGYVAQRGSMELLPWHVVGWLVPLRLSCAIATALPDEPSDRASRKLTLPVLMGSRSAGALMAALAAVSLGLAALELRGDARAALVVPAALAVGSLALVRAAPGTFGMTVRVGLALGATLSFELLLVAWRLRP